MGVGTRELGGTPHVAGAYHHLWTPVAPVGVGLRLSLGASVLPYGRGDGEPLVGDRSEVEREYLHSDFTLIPSAGLALRLHPAAALSLTAHAAVSFLVSDEMGAFAIFPIPTAGLSTSLRLTPSVAVRVSLTALWLYNGDELLIPTVGVVWTL